MGRRLRQVPERGGRTQATYYRDVHGVEPVDRFVTALPAKRGAKIDEQIAEHLTGRPAKAPPPEFPTTSQIDHLAAGRALAGFIYLDKVIS